MDRADAGESLNDMQREAVNYGQGPLLIVAGAGTGKTKTLVHRVVHFVETGIAPDRILLLTFTRRAAFEMLRRAETRLRKSTRGTTGPGSLLQRLWGGTFHSIATRLLRIHGPEIGL